MLQPASSKDTSAGTRTRYMTLLSRRKHTGFAAEDDAKSVNRPLTPLRRADSGRVDKAEGK